MKPLALKPALHLAHRIQEELFPLCLEAPPALRSKLPPSLLGPNGELCTIAGSIRRERPHVNDIDLVCVPRDQYKLRQRVLRNATPIQDGPQNLLVRLANDVQLDIFFARPDTRDLIDKRPSNYASLLLCRTGPREHNIRLIERAKTLALRWNPYEGIYMTVPSPGGPPSREILVPSETEQDLFRHLQLDYLEPKDR